ncbi:MAG: hypothetical protein AAFV53_28765 [Myxococcota bacterium]
MSTRHHVRALCDRLTPAGLDHLLALGAAQPTTDAHLALDARLDALKLGGGAIAMHERTSWGEPTTPLWNLPDHEALLLTALSLRAASAAPQRATPQDAAAHLDALLSQEPDFFDELLLEVSRRFHVMPSFANMLREHANHLRAADAPLRAQDQERNPPEQGFIANVRRLFIGAGDAPRQLRMLIALTLLTGNDSV